MSGSMFCQAQLHFQVSARLEELSVEPNNRLSSYKFYNLSLNIRKHGGRSPISNSLSECAGAGAVTSAMGSGGEGLDISTDGDAGSLGDVNVSV